MVSQSVSLFIMPFSSVICLSEFWILFVLQQYITIGAAGPWCLSISIFSRSSADSCGAWWANDGIIAPSTTTTSTTSTTMYCFLLQCNAYPFCIVLNCIANLYHNIEMCHRFVLHYSIASFSISYCIVSLFLVALFCISFNLSFKYPSYQKSACKTWVNTLEVILRHSCWDIWAYQLRKSLMILWQCLL